MNRQKEVDNDNNMLGERMDEIGSDQPRQPRAGWAEASKEIAERGKDTLILPEFANDFDAEWAW